MGIIEEFLKHEKSDSWGNIYNRLALDSVHDYNNFSKTISLSDKYIDRNRYRDVVPYDNNRIFIKRNSLDFINASFVSDNISKRNYILTQGPLENTAGHFWSMILERNCPAIVMLNKVIENDMVKCFQYFPTKDYPYRYFQDTNIEVNHVSSRNERNFIISKFKIVDLINLKHKTVLHFHYVTWPDFGVPTSPRAFIDFLASVRRHAVLQCKDSAQVSLINQAKEEDEYYGSIIENTNTMASHISTVSMNEESINGPTVIHCSAGIGRSGTFCLVDCCIAQMEMTGNLEINICNTLHAMRKNRSGLVQTAKQLRFSYQAIIEGSQRIMGNGKKFPVYNIPMISNTDNENNQNNQNNEINENNNENNSAATHVTNPIIGDLSNVTLSNEETTKPLEDNIQNSSSESKTELRNRLASEKTERLRRKLSEMKEKQRNIEAKAIVAANRRPYYIAASLMIAATSIGVALYSQLAM